MLDSIRWTLLFAAGFFEADDLAIFLAIRYYPTETNKYETYVGMGKNLEIVVTNGTGEAADLFSDPPYRR